MSVNSMVFNVKDNVTAVIRSIKNEQVYFRQDIEITKKSIRETWGKKYKASLNSSEAIGKANRLMASLRPLRKKIAPVIAITDLVTTKVKQVSSKIKSVSKLVAKPIVSIAVKGMQGLSAAGKAIFKVGKVAAAGLGAAASIGKDALTKMFGGSEDAAFSAMESTATLGRVITNTMGGSAADVENVKALVDKQEQGGVISSAVQIEGLQELGTYIKETESIESLLPVMNDMIAQQYGVNATQEQAASVASMLGSVMGGQTDALSNYGYTLDAAQESIFKFGTESQRASTLAELIGSSVGGMNQALADTDLGQIKMAENAFGKMKESVGDTVLGIKGKLAGLLMESMPAMQGMLGSLSSTMSSAVEQLMPILKRAMDKIVPLVEKVLPVIGSIVMGVIPYIDKFFNALDGDTSGPMGIIGSLVQGFIQLIPSFQEFGTTIMSVLEIVFTSAMPIIENIVATIQTVLPQILPVIGTVLSTIGDLFTQAAPIISFVVSAIGDAITTLAPIFQEIFGAIGAKVGSIIGFISSKMGFLKSVFDFVVPLVADILKTAWSIISPIMDIAISVFKVIFNVVQKVFPAIKKVIETVWNIIKPIFEGIGKALSGVGKGIGWIADKLGGGKKDSGDIETVDLGPVEQSMFGGAVNDIPPPASQYIALPASREIAPPASQQVLVQNGEFNFDDAPEFPEFDYDPFASSDFTMPGPDSFNSTALMGGIGQATEQQIDQSITITIPKLADSITIKEDIDMDSIAQSLTDRIVAAIQNSRPVPTPS